MKILFAIQGTGNGHVIRAREVYPELIRYGDVDVLISGIQADVDVPFPVKYRLYGMSFIFGKKGGVSIGRTLRTLNLPKLIRDIYTLPVQDYDLIINDFEPVSAWACRLRKVKCVGLSHQSAVLHSKAPRPSDVDWLGLAILKHYAPVDIAYGFHFKEYGEHIFTPVIRKEVRQMETSDKGHYTVYLPSYDDEMIVKHLSRFKDTKWEVFSKHNKQPFTEGNVSVRKIDNKAFVASMASGAGVLCGAGFEGPAEALFLGKKLMVIPMQTQYEQHCNAAALKTQGVPVIKSLSGKYHNDIKWWLTAGKAIHVNYPDITAGIIEALIMKETSLSVISHKADVYM